MLRLAPLFPDKKFFPFIILGYLSFFIAGEHAVFRLLRLIPGVSVQDTATVSYDQSTKNLIYDCGLSFPLSFHMASDVQHGVPASFLAAAGLTHPFILLIPPLICCMGLGLGLLSCTMASTRRLLSKMGAAIVSSGMSVPLRYLAMLRHGVCLEEYTWYKTEAFSPSTHSFTATRSSEFVIAYLRE